jgi:hypothetical protein
MKKENLKVGDRIVQVNEEGKLIEYPFEITGIEYIPEADVKIINMGWLSCSYNNVGKSHKYVNSNNKLEDIE